MKEGQKITGHYVLTLAKRNGWHDPRLLNLLDEPLEPARVNDDTIIGQFLKLYGTEFRYDHSRGSWYWYDGAVWHIEKTQLAKSFIRGICRQFVDLEPKLKSLGSERAWAQIERGARSDRCLAVTSDVWNTDDFLLGTPGGTVDLKTGEFREGNPDDLISKSAAVSPIPLDEFDPTVHCPTWLHFLGEALAGDADAIRYFQQWAGYCLTGSTSEQQFLFVYGPGGSGKSTAINTIADILLGYAANVETATLTAQRHARHTTELARLHGVRLARASETEQGQAWAESRIKSLTGEDTVTARFMRRDDFEFRPKFKLTIVGNYQPRLHNVDEAMKRRMTVLPFEHIPAKKDEGLPSKLKREWRGILSWMILGCLDWQKHGLVRPKVAKDATENYFGSQDTFSQWLSECCELGDQFACPGAELWESWQRYAAKEGVDAGSRNISFPESLKRRGFHAVKNSRGVRGRGYCGLQLIPKYEDDLI